MDLPLEFWRLWADAVVLATGACIGSFLNVCIYRIPLEMSVVAPRSRCPGCGHPIAWYDNIPLLSWLLLRARCRHCARPISSRYFVVELLTALLFFGVWRLYGPVAATPIYWLAMSGLVLATFVDLDHMIIPDRVSLGGILAGLACSAAAPELHQAATALRGAQAAAVGAAAGAGTLGLVAVIGRWIFKKDAMGWGDVKLLGAIGAFLGWPAVIFTIVVSSFLGSAAGLTLIALRRSGLRSAIPYGPFIAAAAAFWMLGGSELWAFYLRWLYPAGEALP